MAFAWTQYPHLPFFCDCPSGYVKLWTLYEWFLYPCICANVILTILYFCKNRGKIDRCRWTIIRAMRHSPYNNTRCLNTLHYDTWISSLAYFQTNIMFTINNVNILQAKSLLVRTCKTCTRNSTNTVFHKLSTIQEFQYCQLHFSCAIRNWLSWWSLQSWNVIFLYQLTSYFISHLLTSTGVNKEENYHFIGMKVGSIANLEILWKTRIECFLMNCGENLL